MIPALQYQDAPAAIDFLCKAFGFEEKAGYEGEGAPSPRPIFQRWDGSFSMPIDTPPKRNDTHWLSFAGGGRVQAGPVYLLHRDHAATFAMGSAEWESAA